MKFTCLECGEKEFSVDVREIINEQVAVRLVCPKCGAINQVCCVFSGLDEAEIRLVKDKSNT